MTDLRVLKTQKAVQTAFVDLLYEKEFKDISVQEICDKALVNRNTFYKYYSGKSGLAGKMIAEFRQDYAALLNKRLAARDVRAVMREIMPELYEKRRILLALWRIETRRHRLFQEMQGLLRQAFLAQAAAKFPGRDKNWEFQATLFATCVLTTLRFYFEQNILPPVEQVMSDWREMFDIMHDNL
ncbi:TetR family transcriptional regulator [Neisseria sp.]|uniref:TetR/AcrR family transcriptional regulator n=1 Tax=Neisseria sp. TaxID=192066 RepID=UPI002896ED3C|nr:TetR family transcriptional regulator [Neisseria sp.]